MKHKWPIILLIASAAMAFAIWLSLRFVQYNEVQQRFTRIKVGISQTDALRILGNPNYHKGICGVIVPDRGGCVTEYVYSHPFAPLMPDYYVVTFNRDNRVIEAARWSSP